MYTLVSTIARSFQPDVGVIQVDASDSSIRQLVAENMEVFLTLTHSVLTGVHTLKLSDVYPLIFSAHPTLTVSEWLTSLGNISLPLTEGQPTLTHTSVTMKDAHEAGYRMAPSTGFYGSDTGNVLEEDRPHLALTKVDIDYVAMQKCVLATVGGYLHRTDAGEQGFYVRDGATTQRISKSPKANLISFEHIGELKLIPFSHCTIAPLEGEHLKGGIVVNCPEVLQGKTVWLSIAGHLLYLRRDYFVMNDTCVYIRWSELNMHLKYMTARECIDLSSVNAAMGDIEGDVIDREVLNTNSAILAYLNLSQSFLVVIDNPTVNTYTTRLEDSGLPGVYYAHQTPYTMLLTSDGRIPTVTVTDERKMWVVATSIKEGMVDQYYGETMNPDDTPLFTDLKSTARPHRRAALYQLHVESTLIHTTLG